MNSFGDDESPLDNFSYNDGDLSLFSPDTIPAERADAIRQRTLMQMEAWEGLSDESSDLSVPSTNRAVSLQYTSQQPSLSSAFRSSLPPNASLPQGRGPRPSISRSTIPDMPRGHHRSLSNTQSVLGSSNDSSRLLASQLADTSTICTPEFLQEVSAELIRYHEGVMRMLERENLLPSNAADDLRAVLENIGNAVKHVKNEYEAMSLRSPVLALLELSHICWNFDNETVLHYRNSLMTIEVSPAQLERAIDNAQYPVYISNLPSCPPKVNSIPVVVKLAHPPGVTFSRVITCDTTAEELIAEVVNNKLPGEEPASWLLKAEGLAEYLHGPNSMFIHAWVRQSLRKEKPVVLWLVPREHIDPLFIERITALAASSKETYYERSGRSKPTDLEVVTEDMDVEEIDMSYFSDRTPVPDSALATPCTTSNIAASDISPTPAAAPVLMPAAAPTVEKTPKLAPAPSPIFGLPSGSPIEMIRAATTSALEGSDADLAQQYWSRASSDDESEEPLPTRQQSTSPRLVVDVSSSDYSSRLPSLPALTPRIGYEVKMRPKHSPTNGSGRTTPTIAAMILSSANADTPRSTKVSFAFDDANTHNIDRARAASKLPPPLPPGVATHHIDPYHVRDTTTDSTDTTTAPSTTTSTTTTTTTALPTLTTTEQLISSPWMDCPLSPTASEPELPAHATATHQTSPALVPAQSPEETVAAPRASISKPPPLPKQIIEARRRSSDASGTAVTREATTTLAASDAAPATPTAGPVSPVVSASPPPMPGTPLIASSSVAAVSPIGRRRSLNPEQLSPRSLSKAIPSISTGAAISRFFSPLVPTAAAAAESTPQSHASDLNGDDSDDDNVVTSTFITSSSPVPAGVLAPGARAMSVSASLSQTRSHSTSNSQEDGEEGVDQATPLPSVVKRGSVAARGPPAPKASTSLFRYSIIHQGDSGPAGNSKPGLTGIPTAPGKGFTRFLDDDKGSSLIMNPLPTFASVQDVPIPLRVRVQGVDGVTEQVLPRFEQAISRVYVAMAIVHGTQIIAESVTSTDVHERAAAPRWSGFLEYPIKHPYLNAIPRASKVVFVLCGQIEGKKNDVPLAWASAQMFDEDGNVLSGSMNMGLWPLPSETADEVEMIAMGLGASGFTSNATMRKVEDKDKKKKKEVLPSYYFTKGFDVSQYAFAFKGTNRPNLMSELAPRLTVTFDTFALPIISPQPEPILRAPNQAVIGMPLTLKQLSKDKLKHYELLESTDLLNDLSPDCKALLWQIRTSLTDKSHMLPLFLQSVDWLNVDCRYEAYNLLKLWRAPNAPAQIMALLDVQFADYRVREYAVMCLSRLSDTEIQMYLLQLTQYLKFEPYHDSPLSRFLIQRAVASPMQLGHHLFWSLKNEIDCDPPFAERYTCMLESFLTFCPIATDFLRSQQIVMDRLRRLATAIQARKSKCSEKELNAFYKEQIKILNRDVLAKLPGGKFQIPLDPRWEATTLIPEKCKIMSSKMAPLWLVFNNADHNGMPLYVMFKCGDDLRQDILTLQILRYMDELWLQNGMDLRLSPYNVIATGLTENKKGCGMIEIMLKSCTTAGIQMEYGGGAGGAFKVETLDQYLRDHNKTDEAYQKAVENFTYSCAGYCVATYVMGIGDRHNDNIMLTHDGHLFHIDFGHILGNFKFKYGFKRERSAFVFTPEMAYVMGGKNYESSQMFKEFKQICYNAFLCLRRHASDLENLFGAMLGAGLPELTIDDLQYLRQQLCLELTDAKAIDMFKQEIKKALSATSRRVDNYFHLLKHAKT